MSEENVRVVRKIYEEFAKGNFPAILAVLDPQVEWWVADTFFYAAGNPYIGPDAVLNGIFMPMNNDWDGLTLSPEEVLDAGDTVIAKGYYNGTYKKNGMPLHAQFAHFFTFRDGKIVRFQQYTDTAQFVRVMGE